MHESYIRYSAEEKETIVLSVKRSELSIVQALKRLGIPRRTFYNWYQKYATGGVNALRETPYRRQTTWNRIPDNIRQIVVELSLEHPELTPRELSILLLEESQILAYMTKMCLKSPIHLLFLRGMGLYKVLNEDLSSFHTDSLV